MEIIKNNLFFSRKDKLIFYIWGYSVTNPHPDSCLSGKSLVEDIKKDLNRGVAEFLRIVKTSSKDVHTTVVFKSSRYKYMRVFYSHMNENDIPEETSIFDETMEEVLTS